MNEDAVNLLDRVLPAVPIPLENIPEKVKNGGINAIKKYLRGN
jgi:hypothetical protein